MKTICIIEDQELIRAGIEKIVERSKIFDEIKSYNSGEAFLNDPIDRPHMILLDLGLPFMSGMDVLLQCNSKWPGVLILILTIYEDNEHVFDALKFGASGYILKRDSPDLILESIVELLEGGAPMSRDIAVKVLNNFRQIKENHSLIELSTRENDILDRLSKGLLYKEISDELSLSHNTIRNHLQNIYKKLHVKNRSEAIIKYLNR